MVENEEPLLKKGVVYYENCPGCTLDRKKEFQAGAPVKEILLMGIIVLSNALPISSLFPFLYFMIRDFHVAERMEDIGYYAGYVGSSYMFGRFLTSVLWGMAADRYGRKPVIIIGTASVVIFNTLFGFSTSYWMAILTRLLLGGFNSSLGPVKAYASEICHAENQALALSVVSTAWGIGLIAGPAIGGFWLRELSTYIFGDSVFGRFPYLLPCVCISLFALVVVIACFWLPETMHMHHRLPCEGNTSRDTESFHGQKANLKDDNGRGLDSEKSLIKNWPLMSSIITYCIFSLQEIAYAEIFSLWAVSDRKYGGLGFSTKDVGEVLSFLILGPIMVVRVGAIITIPLLASYPMIAMLSGLILSLAINCASLLKNVLSATIVTGFFIQQNNSVPQHQRGAANGIAMTGMSFFKALGPAGGGSLFACAQERQDSSFLPGVQMVFFTLAVLVLIVAVLTFKPFLPESVKKPYEETEE